MTKLNTFAAPAGSSISNGTIPAGSRKTINLSLIINLNVGARLHRHCHCHHTAGHPKFFTFLPAEHVRRHEPSYLQYQSNSFGSSARFNDFQNNITGIFAWGLLTLPQNFAHLDKAVHLLFI